jgi:O-antigen ligase
MKYLAIAIAVALAVFTAWSIALAPDFVTRSLLSIGFVSVTPFDVVLGLALLGLAAANAFSVRSDAVPVNRFVVWLCIAFTGYQLLVVLPAAVLLHGLRPIDVFRLLEARFDLLLVIVVYVAVLRYCRPEVLVAIFDAAAAALALWVLYHYVTHGPTGYYDDGVWRLRAAWGGAALPFGWLLLSSLFYQRFSLWRLALAALGLTALVVTNHRSGFVALLAALAAQLLATGRLTRRVITALALIAVMGVGVYFSSSMVRTSLEYSFRTMFNANADATSQDRVVRSYAALAYFMQHPLGDYIWNQRYYLVNFYFNFVPHNFAVQRLVTQGIVASALFFAVIVLAFAIAWRNRSDRTSTFMLSYLTFYLTFCALNANIDLRENQALFAVAVALILHQNRVLQEAATESPPVLGTTSVDSFAVASGRLV